MPAPNTRLAALIMADEYDANSSARLRVGRKLIDYIAKGSIFNTLQLHLAPYEMETVKGPLGPSPRSTLISYAASAGVSLSADTINKPFKDLPPRAYTAYIQALYEARISTFVVDDAHRFSYAELKAMTAPVRAWPGTRLVFSSNVNYSQVGLHAARLGAIYEAQAYRQGEDCSAVNRFFSAPVGRVAFECFRNGDGLLTTPDEITRMGQYLLKTPAPVEHISVYAGFDANTDLMSSGMIKHRAALDTVLKAWWAAVEA